MGSRPSASMGSWQTLPPEPLGKGYDENGQRRRPYNALQMANEGDKQAKLRREQATFRDVVRAEGRRNSWLAVPALAPLAIPFLAQGGGLLSGRLLGSSLNRAPLNLLQREASTLSEAPSFRPKPGPPRARPDAEERRLRGQARKRLARANGAYAADWDAEVHHRVALRFRKLFPNADPNRLANLQALESEAHNVVTQATEGWVRSLGRAPTQTEVMAHTFRMDRLIEPYILRAGIPKPPLKP